MLNQLKLANAIATCVDGWRVAFAESMQYSRIWYITVHDNMHIREDSTQTATGKQNTAGQDRKH